MRLHMSRLKSKLTELKVTAMLLLTVLPLMLSRLARLASTSSYRESTSLTTRSVTLSKSQVTEVPLALLGPDFSWRIRFTAILLLLRLTRKLLPTMPPHLELPTLMTYWQVKRNLLV